MLIQFITTDATLFYLTLFMGLLGSFMSVVLLDSVIPFFMYIIIALVFISIRIF